MKTKVTSTLVMIYEYRVCEVQRLDCTWVTGVYRIDYEADGSCKSISNEPIQVCVLGKGKASKKELKREIALYLQAFEKPVFSLWNIEARK